MTTPSYLSLSGTLLLTTLQSADYVVAFSGGKPARIKQTDYTAQLASILPSSGGGGGTAALLLGKVLQSAYYTGDVVNLNYSAAGGSGTYSYFTNDTLPPGLTLSANGTLTGTFTDIGNYSVAVNVIDSSGNDNFTTEIVKITSLVAVTGALGELANHAVISGVYVASGAYSPYTFSVIGTLPPGMSVNPNGTRVGTLTTPGTYTFSIMATDSTGLTGKLVETVIVDPIVLTIAGSAGPYINGSTATGAYTVSGNGTAPYTFSATGLPPGMVVATDGTISGTVTTNGTYVAVITATDANSETATYDDTIVVGVLTVANTTTTATNNAVYSGTLAISGVYVDPLSVSMSGAPAWLSAAISGATVQFSGTPGSSDTTATFNVTVTDSASQSTTVSVTLSVVLPAILVSGNISSIYSGVAFSGAYTASGGAAPYTFAANGTLPPGLVVGTDGTRSGTASTIGSYTFTITATDANSITGTLSDTLAVTSAPHSEWNPSQANSTIVVSNGVATNSIAGSTAGTTSGEVISDTQVTQKTYIEFLIKTPAGADAGVGIVTSVPDFVYGTNKVGDGHPESGIYVPSGGINQTYTVYTVTVATDGTANEYRLGMAIDPTASKYWVTFNGGTTWVNGADGSPGDPVNGLHTITWADIPGSVLYLAASPQTGGNTIELLSDPAFITGTVPSGFTAGLIKT